MTPEVSNLDEHQVQSKDRLQEAGPGILQLRMEKAPLEIGPPPTAPCAGTGYIVVGLGYSLAHLTAVGYCDFPTSARVKPLTSAPLYQSGSACCLVSSAELLSRASFQIVMGPAFTPVHRARLLF